MEVTFYRNNSDNRTVNKSLTTIKTIGCWIKDDCSMLNPTIKISRDALPSFANVNYMYIDTFGRYYNISPSSMVMVGDFVEITGEVDPLYSNANAIRNVSCVVLRQENKYNKYYQDTELPIRAEKTFIYKKVGSLPDVKTNVLTVDGG